MYGSHSDISGNSKIPKTTRSCRIEISFDTGKDIMPSFGTAIPNSRLWSLLTLLPDRDPSDYKF